MTESDQGEEPQHDEEAMAAAIAAAIAEDNQFLNIVEEPEKSAQVSEKLDTQYMKHADVAEDEDENQENKRSEQAAGDYVEEEESSSHPSGNVD